ncbi:MAG: hypothetical protein JWM68_385 [Verrucomicrobiales bacterium]|nr:hypothetical protein [Verrucomicrobiales bacterium]
MKQRLGKLFLILLFLGTIGFAVFAWTRETVFVYDAETKKPIEGARVSVVHMSFNRNTYITSLQGRVRLWEVFQNYGIQVSKEGYETDYSFLVPQNRTNRTNIGLKIKR